MIHVAGQFGGQMSAAVPGAELGHFRHRRQRLSGLHADPAAARPGHVDPGISVPLLTGKCVGVDAPGIGILAGQGRDLHALAGLRLEDPSVILASDRAAIEPSAGERDATMGATVAHGEDAAVLFFAPQYQGDSEQHRGGHLPALERAAAHGWIPVVVDEGFVRSQQIARRVQRRFPPRCRIECHRSRSRKTCTYYSATASDFLLASPPLLAVEEKSNEGIISVCPGFTCRKPVARYPWL